MNFINYNKSSLIVEGFGLILHLLLDMVVWEI
jgi:hypothetical protein